MASSFRRRTIADGEYSLEGPARSGPALIILNPLVLTLEPGTNFPSSFSTLPGKETNNFLAAFLTSELSILGYCLLFPKQLFFMALVLSTGVDKALLKTRRLILESAGHKVATVMDETALLAACKEHSFDVAVIGQTVSAISNAVLARC